MTTVMDCDGAEMPVNANSDQAMRWDSVGDVCDADDDGDGIAMALTIAR